MKNKINQNQLLNLAIVIILCAISFGAGFWINRFMKSPNEVLLDTAFDEISKNSFFNQQSGLQLSYSAIRGMINSLNDPYAELIEPKAAKNFTNTFIGQTGVVGLYAQNINNQAVISIVFPNGSADKAGVRVGDVILAIDKVELDKATDSSETGLMLRGVPGSSVHLKIMRDGKILEYDLIRQLREYVSFSMLPGGIGYITLNAFNQAASQQMKAGIESLLAQKATGLIWDLRNNEGGDMASAQDILSYFIKDGLLFTADLTNNRTVPFFAKGQPIAPDIPLIVLMDKTTYSAAETCAAAISETGRGKTIGSPSFGKGVIQETVPLMEDTLLQMTIAKWLSPKGEWFHGNGVPPQIEVINDPATDSDEPLQAAIDLLSKK